MGVRKRTMHMNILLSVIQRNAMKKTDLEAGQKATYNIALNIAKKGKPHTIGEEVIIAALREVIRYVIKANADTVLQSVPLSASTVKRRIDEMATNVEKYWYQSCGPRILCCIL